MILTSELQLARDLLQQGVVEHTDILRKPILDSRKLLTFVTLAHCGSFTQTARELFLTQSAVSHAIKSLEDELECRLFDRMGRKATLTQSGQHLLEYAARILEDMQLARADLKTIDQPQASRFPGPWQKVASQ